MLTAELLNGFGEFVEAAERLTHPDADRVAAWADEHGHKVQLYAVPAEFLDVTGSPFRACVRIGEHGIPAYYGHGDTPTEAIHEASAFLRRDHGFGEDFSERCDSSWCPFCTDTPFPTDEGRP